MPSLTTYTLLKQEHSARRGEFKTVHGTVQTPAFQNVATAGAIKGGLSAQDLKDIGAQVMLCNTYHLHLRPGDKLVADMGGLHKFTRWNGPILTDSGGFQVFSLAKLRKITEEGVTFASHLDGHRIFMGPEESMQIQANLGSTIAMAFDECVENPAQHDYSKDSCERTTRWLKRCKAEMARLKHEGISVNPDQLLFGINQGCTYADLRVEHMKQIAEPYIRQKAVRHFEKGRIVIFGCGTGSPFFSTDSAAALRAAEINADILLKATMVDGIYDKDPHKYDDAVKYDSLTHQQILVQSLKVMDSAAAAMCRENKTPILVFDLSRPDNIFDAVMGKKIGTVVSDK